MEKTTLINLRAYKGSDWTRVARIDRLTGTGKTGLGNPHKIGEYNFYLKRRLTREDAVMLFRKTFENKMKNYPEFATRVEGLRGKKIACWCTPLACHGDVYVEYFENGPWW